MFDEVFGSRPWRLPFIVGQKLAVHGNDHTISFGIFLFFDIQDKIDGTHDAVAKFFVNNGFKGHSVNLHDLIKAVDQRVGGNDRAQPLQGAFSKRFGNIGEFSGAKNDQNDEEDDQEF